MSTAVFEASAVLYSPSLDGAVSSAGDELRESIRAAMATPSDDEGRTAEILQRIRAALRKGTEAEGVLVSATTFGRLCDLLSTLPAWIPLPEVVVESDREIGLDWYSGERDTLSVSVDDTGYVGFAALIDQEPLYGKLPFAGAFPKTLAYFLRRLYPA